MTYHERFMAMAIEEARSAYDEEEVPVGAILVRDGRVVARGHNQMVRLNDPTAHAEMIAITAGAAAIESRRLTGCTLYVTLEPCPMCAGAIVNARLDALVFGAYDSKAGAATTLYSITNDPRLNHRVHTVGGIMDSDCAALLRQFFEARRGAGEGA